MPKKTRPFGKATRALLLPLCLAATASAASAATLDYDFRIEWQSGVLAGTLTTGRFSFDDHLPDLANEFFSTGLLSAFTFTSGAGVLSSSTVDTGWLRFDPQDALTGTAFGSNCNPTCSARGDMPGEWWFNWSESGPRAAVAADGSGGFSWASALTVVPHLPPAVPEPAGWLLLALGVPLIAAHVRHRR